MELKFVQSMKRQYEFSVDSFQVILDTYLTYHQAVSDSDSTIETTERFYPTVLAESVYGDFAAALRHLRQRRICTHRPEEIRGGGLLRYCNLLVRDFTPGDCEGDEEEGSASSGAITRLEQHMCSRFFIDFGDIERQQKKLLSYLDSHFQGEEELKFQYLLVLRRVVDTSTICLMHHERTMILDLITVLARQSLATNLGQSLPHLTYFTSNGSCVASSSSSAEGSYSSACSNSSNSPFLRSVPSSNPAYSRPSTPSSFCKSTTDVVPSNTSFVQQSYCCPCCCQYFHSSYYYSSSYLPNLKIENYPTLVQPIYYDPSRMTCIYQPAGYGNNLTKS